MVLYSSKISCLNQIDNLHWWYGLSVKMGLVVLYPAVHQCTGLSPLLKLWPSLFAPCWIPVQSLTIKGAKSQKLKKVMVKNLNDYQNNVQFPTDPNTELQVTIPLAKHSNSLQFGFWIHSEPLTQIYTYKYTRKNPIRLGKSRKTKAKYPPHPL